MRYNLLCRTPAQKDLTAIGARAAWSPVFALENGILQVAVMVWEILPVNFSKMAFDNHNSQRFIYLADDDSDDREFFADAVSEINFDVILRQVPDGMHLMNDLFVLSSSELPEFIFLDINMPGKSGLECLQEIRGSEGALKEVNVVMFSTSSDPENIRRASELGATYYAVKPSCFEKLKYLLEEVLSMSFVGAVEDKKKFLLV